MLTRPFVLLRFRKPEYETNANGGAVSWPIERGLLVAPAGRGRGYLRLAVSRDPDAEGEEVVTTVSSEVVNFYPLIAGWGWFARIGQLHLQPDPAAHPRAHHARLPALAREPRAGAVAGGLAQPSRSPVISRSFARS